MARDHTLDGCGSLRAREARHSCGDTGPTVHWFDPDRIAYQARVEAERAALPSFSPAVVEMLDAAARAGKRPDWFAVAADIAHPDARFADAQIAGSLALDAGIGGDQ